MWLNEGIKLVNSTRVYFFNSVLNIFNSINTKCIIPYCFIGHCPLSEICVTLAKFLKLRVILLNSGASKTLSLYEKLRTGIESFPRKLGKPYLSRWTASSAGQQGCVAWICDKHKSLPVILFVPFHQTTFGMGFPPPDSQVSVISSPSVNGPIVEAFWSSVLSSLVIFTYSGLTEIRNKKHSAAKHLSIHVNFV